MSVYSAVIWVYLDTHYCCPTQTVLVSTNGSKTAFCVSSYHAYIFSYMGVSLDT